jgi:hypothetical protein
MKTEAEVYVIYIPSDGFVTGRTTMRFTTDFTKARVYNRECDAQNSKNMWDGTKNKGAHVIPVKLTLDPKALFKTVLKGA